MLAYLSVTSGPVDNAFTPATDTDPSISETFTDKKIKENVSINVGDPGYAVYVRAAIVVTWKAEGEGSEDVLADKPVLGTDYNLELCDLGWFEKGGFYYHTDSVISGGSTSVLIKSAEQIKDAPEDGYVLSIEIISQTIQALGSTDVVDDPYADGIPAVSAAWGVSVDANGRLTYS